MDNTAPNFTCQECGWLRQNKEAADANKRWCIYCADEFIPDDDAWEDPALEYAREQAEARQGRYEMWRREY